jgi:hypothetical protein
MECSSFFVSHKNSIQSYDSITNMMQHHQRQNHIAHAARQATLNNIVASFLHIGDYSTAVAQFTEALKAIQKFKGIVEPDNKMANLVSLDNCMIHSYPVVIHTKMRECSHADDQP